MTLCDRDIIDSNTYSVTFDCKINNSHHYYTYNFIDNNYTFINLMDIISVDEHVTSINITATSTIAITFWAQSNVTGESSTTLNTFGLGWITLL